ncbi:tbc1 domain family protein [Phaffia rhodozyma]|uniref:Tbc1 domain family protein n=1 Tax=Phaffia rhodozyma TaxID=264483 RepID=A0A0F7SVG8_PHARH|nr:tbc1 domain family protein [Phaffia rhodozyma]
MSRIYPSHQSNSSNNSKVGQQRWDQDDAWDSASDSEDPVVPKTAYVSKPSTSASASGSGSGSTLGSTSSTSKTKQYPTPTPSSFTGGSHTKPHAQTEAQAQLTNTVSSLSLGSRPAGPSRTPSSFLSSLGGVGRRAASSSATSLSLPHRLKSGGEDEDVISDSVRLTSKKDDHKREPSGAAYEVLVSDPSIGLGITGGDGEDIGDDEEEAPAEPKGGVMKADIEHILADPVHTLRKAKEASNFQTPEQIGSPSLICSPGGNRLGRVQSLRTRRTREKLEKLLLNGLGVDSGELKSLAWNGVPNELRPIVWQMLLGYLPLPTAPRMTTLSRKRNEYQELSRLAFKNGTKSLDQQIWHQIVIDVPRTRPGVPLWSMEPAMRSLERILYVWAIRHPASGYVQGINDLVIPFFQIFLSAYIETDPETFDIAQLPPHILSAIEADSFWCLSKLLDGIQDNYIFAQPGIHRSVRKMAELVGRIDPPLASHMEEQGVEFMQFAFRWMNCLLMREISMQATIRMWDTYLAEGAEAFSQFHLYVCSAFLVNWSQELMKKDFQEIIMYLQSLPTQNWTDVEVRVLLSEAYVLMKVWQDADAHFTGTVSAGGGMGGLTESIEYSTTSTVASISSESFALSSSAHARSNTYIHWISWLFV